MRPEKIVWIFGTGRSGSTWLGSMMEGLEGCAMWNEPLVGNLFGNFHYFRVGGRKSGRQYILGEPYKETWLGPMRDLVLGGAAARFPEVSGYLIIKEPNGSIGAPLLMEALPESRMIFLIRDPRDVVASSMDARSEGSWLSERREAQRSTSTKQTRNPNVYVRMRANSYVQQIEKTRQAYRAHGGLKVLVRYEDLRADTLQTMKRIYSELEMPVEEAELARSVEKHSWEKIPRRTEGRGQEAAQGEAGRLEGGPDRKAGRDSRGYYGAALESVLSPHGEYAGGAVIRDAWRKVRGRGMPEETGGMRPENLVWVFGTARTGSSWLSAIMGEVGGYSRWHEPLVGHLFGNLYYERAGHRSEDEHFILGARHRELWLGTIRRFVLDSAAARFPGVAAKDGGYLIVKEPQGSMGAPLLMEALPESRMILLVRDPRDVVASNLDAHKGGTWTADLMRKGGKEKPPSLAESRPDAFVKGQARRYVRDVGNAKKAYDAHGGLKVLVRYEDLRADTLQTMKRIYSELEMPVEEAELARSVEKHSWEKIPDEQKGEGKFHRKAKPGGWREDLTARQAEIVEGVAGSLLRELYPVRSTA